MLPADVQGGFGGRGWTDGLVRVLGEEFGATWEGKRGVRFPLMMRQKVASGQKKVYIQVTIWNYIMNEMKF